MRCTNCRKQTPDTELYCRHCGTKLEIGFEEITTKLSKEITREKIAETEAFFRWIMLIVLFTLIAGIFFRKLWVNTPFPTLTPGYLPDIKIEQQWPVIEKPLIIRK